MLDKKNERLFPMSQWLDLAHVHQPWITRTLLGGDAFLVVGLWKVVNSLIVKLNLFPSQVLRSSLLCGRV